MLRLSKTLIATSAFVLLGGPVLVGCGNPSRRVIYTKFNAAPINIGDSVMFRGVRVGTVKTVVPNHDSIDIVMSIERNDVPLRRADTARVARFGPLGTNAIEIVSGPLSSRLLVGNDTLIAKKYVPPSYVSPAAVKNIGEALIDLVHRDSAPHKRR